MLYIFRMGRGSHMLAKLLFSMYTILALVGCSANQTESNLAAGELPKGPYRTSCVNCEFRADIMVCYCLAHSEPPFTETTPNQHGELQITGKGVYKIAGIIPSSCKGFIMNYCGALKCEEDYADALGFCPEGIQ